MCEPVSITLGVLAVASAATSIIGQNTQRQAQKGYQNKLVEANKAQMEANRSIATRSYLDQAEQANNNLAQEREAAAVSNQDTSIQASKARGEVVTAGAEAGAGGLALDGLLMDFHQQESMFRAHNDQNLVFKQQQTASVIKGDRNQAVSRIAQIQPYIPSPIAPVDYVGPFLQAGGTMLGAKMNSMNAQTSTMKTVGGPNGNYPT